MIQWFPGHMHNAIKKIKTTISNIDVIIEIVDSRCPKSSSNHLFENLTNNKLKIKILSKKDLADENTTIKWLNFYKNNVFSFNLKNKKCGHRIINICKSNINRQITILKPINAIVIGFPNVGKSTLINTIVGKKITRTGNEPAVTKLQEKIKVDDKFYLYDTPGIMLPFIEKEERSYILATISAIKDTAIDYSLTANFILRYLNLNYPNRVNLRYKITKKFSDELLNQIGKKIGVKINYNISKKIIHDFRKGYFGKVSLENPS